MSKANRKFSKNNDENKEDRPKISREENMKRNQELRAKNYNNTKKAI